MQELDDAERVSDIDSEATKDYNARLLISLTKIPSLAMLMQHCQ